MGGGVGLVWVVALGELVWEFAWLFLGVSGLLWFNVGVLVLVG